MIKIYNVFYIEQGCCTTSAILRHSFASLELAKEYVEQKTNRQKATSLIKSPDCEYMIEEAVLFDRIPLISED